MTTDSNDRRRGHSVSRPKAATRRGATALNGQLSLNGLEDKKKLRGSYYTPGPIAAFLAQWAIKDRNARVMEPSAGDGQIVAAAASRLGDGGRITAVELDSAEAAKAAEAGMGRALVENGDFFAWFLNARPDGTFDAVVGNPPFIRYQDFPEKHRQLQLLLLQMFLTSQNFFQEV